MSLKTLSLCVYFDLYDFNSTVISTQLTIAMFLTTGVTACLCTTSFCNVGDPTSEPSPKPTNVVKDEPTQRTATVRTEVITTRPRTTTTTPAPPRRTQPLQEQRPAAVKLQPRE